MCALVVQFEVIFGMYPQVVHIDLESSLGDHVSEDVIHERLKSWRSITEAEEHYGGFKEAERSDECRFPLVFFPNSMLL